MLTNTLSLIVIIKIFLPFKNICIDFFMSIIFYWQLFMYDFILLEPTTERIRSSSWLFFVWRHICIKHSVSLSFFMINIYWAVLWEYKNLFVVQPLCIGNSPNYIHSLQCIHQYAFNQILWHFIYPLFVRGLIFIKYRMPNQMHFWFIYLIFSKNDCYIARLMTWICDNQCQ